MTTPTPFIPRRDAEAVAIGASAGGVQALRELLGALPADFTPALLVVLHLPSGRETRLAELLGAVCALPVAEALDGQPVHGGTVTLAPPDYHLLVEPDRTLSLSVDDPVLFSRPAIDPLFESAAAAFGARLLALLLTGASTDGSAGLAAVRRHGGQAWVEDPATACVPTMPAAALGHAGADAVLTLDEMRRRLAACPP
ncbi:chemotaxis protein CheB [Azohydromonas caseinilytica]|uniref:protein-glutamate methylesterase n=1 Tax=Azohydromonas caseinilytica TaxID=2728836 RepID=A0A848FK48_9BURK|nr:chemotaxis protein CheB [Azohydromonas caseinilytica]NML18709.1 chemotaxis protein CheB [Azohydromonas caseinilytica]